MSAALASLVAVTYLAGNAGIQCLPSPANPLLEWVSLRDSTAAILEKSARSNSTGPVEFGRVSDDVVVRVGAAGREAARLSCVPGDGG